MPTALKVRTDPYRRLLLKKRDELLASVKGEPEALSASIQTPDAVEFAVKTAEQDVTAVTVEIRSRMLKEIEVALERMAQGTYGECEGCGMNISPGRLKALPWARYCVTCQELRSWN
jgi:DnaK suppressor protein